MGLAKIADAVGVLEERAAPRSVAPAHAMPVLPLALTTIESDPGVGE